MSRKKIIRKEPFSPNVFKVIYEDGSIGFQGGDLGPNGKQNQEIEIPNQGRDGGLKAWGESMDANPASAEELRQIEEALDSMRRLDPTSTVREVPIPGPGLPLPEKAQPKQEEPDLADELFKGMMQQGFSLASSISV